MNNMIKIFKFGDQELHFRTSAGSHIPLLRKVTKFISVKTVIEFGTGVYSLRTFLDKKYYPELENIYSYETENMWADYIRSIFSDNRWTLTMMDRSIQCLSKIKFPSPVDLVFVDGMDEQRTEVIKNYKSLSNVFVLHDCDIDMHKNSIKEFKYNFIYKPRAFRHTAILSNTINVSSFDWDIKWDTDFLKWI